MLETTEKLFHRKCPVCNQKSYKTLFSPPRSPGPVVQCLECDFVYINPITTKESLIQEGPVLYNRPAQLLESSNLDDIFGSWEQPIIEQYLSELSAKKRNADDALSYIDGLTTTKGTLLDLGCFCGVFLNQAARAGWDCYGIEPLVMPAIYARGKYGLRITTDTLREYTFPPEFFDVITSFQVFEHLINPKAELSRILRILKTGGLLLIEVPNIETPFVRLLRSRHRHFVQDHVSFFSKDTLSRLLEEIGFSVRKVYYPTRIISLRHFIWWAGRYSVNVKRALERIAPEVVTDRLMRIKLGDIIAVIAEKTN